MNLKRIRDTKGKFATRKTFLIALTIIILTIFTGAIYSKPVTVEIEAKVVDSRDAIQKITDNIAVSYRQLQITEKELSKVQTEHMEALEEYTSALESFSIYQQ